MITKIEISSDNLKVQFNNENSETFTNIWLRDHAKDEVNWDKRSNQRKTFTAGLDLDLKIKNVEILENGKSLSILWPDLDKPVNYSYEFLSKNIVNNNKKKPKYNIWKAKDLNSNIFFEFKETKTKQGFKNFLKILYDYGFIVLKNCEKNMNPVEEIANKIGYVRNSIFGGLWSFQSNENKADSAYTQEELRPHTDGTYCHDAPGLQILLCCEYDASGGESIMVDGFKIAEVLKVEDEETYKILTEIEVPGNYIGDGVCLEARRPVFKLSLDGKISQVSFNNYDRGVFRLNNQTGMQLYKAIRSFDKLANNRKMQWRKILEPGEMLIFDNWRVMHGRGEFTGKRKMSGCYINREDFESSCRMHNLSI